MSKKNKNQEVSTTETTEVVETEKVETTKEKPVKVKKAKKEKQPRENKAGRKVKETVSELKKVSWPSFKDVCKRTGIVVTFVLICTVILFGIDRLLSLIYTLLIGK